jgi:hypothetical protein
LTTSIDFEDGTASLERAMEVAGYFELDANAAREVAAEVGQAVATWRSFAARPQLLADRPHGVGLRA